jgi:hypothetical protein
MPEQRIICVEFRSEDGRSWRAVGGGTTVADAVRRALDNCPGDTEWDAVNWEDLYGD